MTTDRRTFLKRSGSALSLAAVSGCAPGAGPDGGEARAGRLDPVVLRACADVALPSELDAEARQAAVEAFERWAYAYEPVAELNHGYGTSEIRYSQPDPVPAWSAQLDALELEAQRRGGSSFASLEPRARLAMIQGQGLDGGSGMPAPLRAEHVSIALLAHWLRSADATDRCYGRRIMERECRGIPESGAEPEAV